MSWLSQFVDDPIEFIEDKPLKALALVGAPIAALAAPFVAPEIGAAVGLGEGAAGLGASEGLLGGAAGLEGAFGGAAGGTTAGEGILGGLGLGEGVGGESLASLAGLPEQGALGYASDAFPLSGGDVSSWMADPSAGLGGGDDAMSAMAYSNETPSYAPPAMEEQWAGNEPLSSSSGGATPEEPGFLSKTWNSAKNYVSNNPFSALGAGVGAAGLAYNLMNGQKTSPNVAAMNASAQAQSAQAKELMGYFEKGQLPPGLQNIANQMLQAMNANAVSNAANHGMPTTVKDNTALANAFIDNQQRVFGWIAQQSMQLLNAGVQLSGLSNQLYGMLEQLDRQKSAQTGQAIANFAAALNGAGGYRPQMAMVR